MTTREPTPQDYRDMDAALSCISRSLDAVHRLIAPLTGTKSPVEGRVRTAREKVDGARALLREQSLDPRNPFQRPDLHQATACAWDSLADVGLRCSNPSHGIGAAR